MNGTVTAPCCTIRTCSFDPEQPSLFYLLLQYLAPAESIAARAAPCILALCRGAPCTMALCRGTLHNGTLQRHPAEAPCIFHSLIHHCTCGTLHRSTLRRHPVPSVAFKFTCASYAAPVAVSIVITRGRKFSLELVDLKFLKPENHAHSHLHVYIFTLLQCDQE